jgi:hypothetical protein
MTLLNQSLLLYVTVGLAVAAAVYLSDLARRPSERWFLMLTAVFFWPIYLPILLSRGGKPSSAPPAPSPPRDDLAAAIAQVDAELESALNSLDGWASDVLARERGRLRELRSAWTAQAERIREMDRLLAQPESAPPRDASNERLRHSEEARLQNLARLRRVRQKAHDDLLGTLAWVRELVSMIHLAKFTGEPAARAEELVAQIAAAVEGLSEVASEDTLQT